MTSGIYQIRNTQNDKIYIGRSVNIPTRKRNHFRELSNGKHKNIKLQRAYNQYGKDSFIFEILELCDPDRTKDREQWHLDRLDPTTSYNIARSSDGGDTTSQHPNRLEWASAQSDRMKQLMVERPDLNESLQVASRAYWQLDENQARRIASFAGSNNPFAGSSRTGESNPFFGKTHSEETKAKLRESSKRTHTDDSKAAMKAARSCKYQVDGILFDQLKGVMEHYGVSRKYVHRRFRSDEFPTWRII